jgi:hypothetical protein
VYTRKITLLRAWVLSSIWRLEVVPTHTRRSLPCVPIRNSPQSYWSNSGSQMKRNGVVLDGDRFARYIGVRIMRLCIKSRSPTRNLVIDTHITTEIEVEIHRSLGYREKHVDSKPDIIHRRFDRPRKPKCSARDSKVTLRFTW